MNNNYMNPVIPRGFEHVSGTWDDAFLIQDKEGNSFTWLPVGALKPNGTLDGIHFNSKLGRRNFNGDVFGKDDYWEEYDIHLKNTALMVENYGGVYVGKYHISEGRVDTELIYYGKYHVCEGWDRVMRIVPKAMPVTHMAYWNAEQTAKIFSNEDVSSCLMSGAVYDSILEWIIESGAKTLDEVTKDSTSWGNYYNFKDGILPTATRKEFIVKGVAGLAGNIWEWTTENYGRSEFAHMAVIRGGNYGGTGSDFPASFRRGVTWENSFDLYGFRCVLYLNS